MILPVRRHPAVEQDVLGIGAWFARRSPETAWRFFESFENSVTSLAFMPGKGSPKRVRDKRFAGARTWAVNRFPKYLILYLIRSDHVFVVAVVHGARRYRSVLADRLG